MRLREQEEFRARVGLETGQSEGGAFEHFEARAGLGKEGEGRGGQGPGYGVDAEGVGGLAFWRGRGRKWGMGQGGGREGVPVESAG